MNSLLERVGYSKTKIKIRQEQFIDLFTNSDLVTNQYAQKEIFDQIILFVNIIVIYIIF